jgi:DNA-binding NarL/FixJ family response regulator
VGNRVVLAVRDGSENLRAALEAAGFEICATTCGAEETVQRAVAERPAVCLLDLEIEGGGIRAAETITRELAETAVVIMADDLDEDELFAALRAGATGFLPHDIDPQRLPVALAGVLEGEVAIPRTLMARVVEEFRGTGCRRIRVGERTVELTAREREVLERLQRGRTTKQIGAELFISPVTVRRHISTLLHKLRVDDREQAVELLNGRSDG